MTVNANSKIYDKAIDRAAMIRLYERRVTGKVELVIDGHTVRVDKLIREAKLSQKGFDRLRDAIDLEIQSTFKEVYNTSKRSLLDLVSDQVSYAYQNVEVAMGKIWATEKPNRRIAEEIVLQRPLIEDKTLAAGWAGVSASEKTRLESVIRKGIADGLSVDEIALEVRKGNVHNITRMQSKALVVTSITSVTAQADHEVYRANEKALHGWQYVAVLDARTTPLCSHRDGHIYPIGDTAHLPPAHFNCRSTTVPVFKSWDDISKLEGVAEVRRRNLQNLTDKQIAFYDGQTPMRETYNEWLLRQPKDVQIRHLGDYQKVELFNSGQLTLDKFTNPEGNSIGIKELRAMSDNGYDLPNDTKKFALAKQKLDAMHLGDVITCSAEVNITNFSGTSGNLWVSLPLFGSSNQASNGACRISGSWGASVDSVQALVSPTTATMLFTRLSGGAESFDLAGQYSGAVNLYLRFTVSYFAD